MTAANEDRTMTELICLTCGHSKVHNANGLQECPVCGCTAPRMVEGPDCDAES